MNYLRLRIMRQRILNRHKNGALGLDDMLHSSTIKHARSVKAAMVTANRP